MSTRVSIATNFTKPVAGPDSGLADTHLEKAPVFRGILPFSRLAMLGEAIRTPDLPIVGKNPTISMSGHIPPLPPEPLKSLDIFCFLPSPTLKPVYAASSW
jgi:hypothetical protein